MGLPCQWLYAYAVDSLQREAANVIFLTYRSVSVSLMRQGDPREGLGEEMYEAFKNKTKIPQADDQLLHSSHLRRIVVCYLNISLWYFFVVLESFVHLFAQPLLSLALPHEQH